jgi:hypothetical protein
MQDMYAADAEVDFSAAFPDTAVINELFLDTDAALAVAKAAA